MILTKYIKTNVNKRNKDYYKSLGYNVSKKEITINPYDLTKGSNKKIIVQCEVCETVSELSFNKWYENTKRGGYYSCKKCSKSKRKNVNTNNEKQKSTKKSKYGEENYNNIEKIKEKREEFYSFENIVKRIKNKNIKLYNKPFPFFYEVDLLDIINKSYKIMCRKGHEYQIDISEYYKRKEAGEDTCKICNPFFQQKDSLENIKEYIESLYKGETIYKPDILNPFECDIFIPEKNIIIDYIDIYEKCEVYKKRKYFIEKAEKIKEHGFYYYKIYSDDFKEKPDIIKSDLMKILDKSNILNFNKIQKIDDLNLVKKFLKENCILGWKKYKIKLGLFQNENLISLLCLNKKNRKWIIDNFCELKCHTINNSFYILIEKFIEEFGENPIYKNEKTEFKILNGKRIKSFSKKSLMDDYDDKPESELFIERGIFRIW
jgi:hypothetical protein